jgi:ribonuclease M5
VKKLIEAAIIVGGKSDDAFLESFIDAEFVITNGSSVPRETISYLQELSKTKTLIVLTDPDGPGTRIRHILDQHIDNLQHAFVNKKDAVKNGKVGVAESIKDCILESLKNTIATKTINQGRLTTSHLIDLGLVGNPWAKGRREFISNYFHLGFNNGKQLLFRLNNLNISITQIKTALNQYE